MKKDFKKFHTVATLIMGLALLILAVAYIKLNRDYIANGGKEQKEIVETVKNLQKHVLIPENEIPQVATVVDAGMLIKEKNPFYKNVKNGDQLIVFQTMIYLYDPVVDRVLNIDEVQLPQNTQPQTGTGSASGTVTVE